MLRKVRRWLGKPDPFGLKHLRRREEFRADYEVLAHSLLSRLDFETVMDVGCANGFLLSAFLAQGKEVSGVELSPHVHEVLPRELIDRVRIADFSEIEGRWDLVCCVEVAEHIPPQRSEDLVRSVSSGATRWIYFTAAPPGQSGHGHINCRPHEEWLGWFGGSGWVANDALTAGLREDLERVSRAHWLGKNSFILEPAAVSVRDEH